MIIYNITTQTGWAIHDGWKRWMLDMRIPYLMSAGLFTGYQFVKLMEIDETDGATYALQLYCESDESLQSFRKHWLPGISEEEYRLWGDNMVSFASVMQVIN